MIRSGFELNLLVLGEEGVGKRSLINSLFKVNQELWEEQEGVGQL